MSENLQVSSEISYSNNFPRLLICAMENYRVWDPVEFFFVIFFMESRNWKCVYFLFCTGKNAAKVSIPGSHWMLLKIPKAKYKLTILLQSIWAFWFCIRTVIKHWIKFGPDEKRKKCVLFEMFTMQNINNNKNCVA